jgi:hypothetical protein
LSRDDAHDAEAEDVTKAIEEEGILTFRETQGTRRRSERFAPN